MELYVAVYGALALVILLLVAASRKQSRSKSRSGYATFWMIPLDAKRPRREPSRPEWKREFNTSVHGTSHRNADGSSRQRIISRCHIGEQLHLVREPSNPIDDHAIAVLRSNGEQIGYIGAHLAYRMVDEMDRGHRFDVFISDITGHEGRRRRYGVNLLIGVPNTPEVSSPKN
jgi:hypothetical protein